MRSPKATATHLSELLVRSSPDSEGASYRIQIGPIGGAELPTGVLISLEFKLVSFRVFRVFRWQAERDAARHLVWVQI